MRNDLFYKLSGLVAGLWIGLANPAYAKDSELLAGGFEQTLGMHFSEILQAVQASGVYQRAMNPATRGLRPLNHQGQPGQEGLGFKILSHDEPEIRKCPAGAEPLSRQPDPDLFTYLGFRHVRSDGSTCAAQPSDKVFYQDPDSQELRFAGSEEPPARNEPILYNLSVPEYRIRRNFYFGTDLDGNKRFYSYDFKDKTGKQIPEAVQLLFANRVESPLLPWEPEETFSLEFGRISGASLTPLRTNYEYQIQVRAGKGPEGNLLTAIDATAVRKKTLTSPDPKAVSLALVRGGPGHLLIEVHDVWAKYYRAEKLGLKIRLWRNRFLIGDKVAYEMDIALDAQNRIVINPADPQWDAFKKEAIKKGGEYYADWSFRRADSRISTGEWIEKGRTNRAKLE